MESQRFAFISDVAASASRNSFYQERARQIILETIGPVNDMLPNFFEMRTARDRGKIEAIKAHRNRTGAGLKESKDAIEAAAEQLGIAFYGQS